MERYLPATYSNSYQPFIITKTPETYHNPKMPTIIPDMGVEHPKTNTEITNIDKDILQKMRKNDVYANVMHNIYNLIVGHTNEQLQEKAASDATLQEVKTGRDPIWYLMILKKI